MFLTTHEMMNHLNGMMMITDTECTRPTLVCNRLYFNAKGKEIVAFDYKYQAKEHVIRLGTRQPSLTCFDGT